MSEKLYQSLLLNLDEIWLKGLNRKFYVKTLRKSVRKTVRAHYHEDFNYQDCGPKHILRTNGVGFGFDVIEALSKVAGLNSISPARRIPLEFESICPAIQQELEGEGALPKTFRITTKRSNKNFPLKSMEISRQVGGWVKAHFGIIPKMEHPELNITLRILQDSIFISTTQIKGVGGLPVGTSGHMICMLSGGFDSPVASYLLSKRGVDQTFVFFYSYPYVGEEVKHKIIELVRILSQYQRFSPLFIIPFGSIQKGISDHCKPDYRTILFRQYMVMAANQLAKKVKAKGLITGDALSQVSSQTLENMSVVDQSSELPIFRPLVGFNKVEIIDLSKKVGTHDISIQPHDDACSLFSPKHPVIRADQKYCHQFSQNHPMNIEIEKAILEAEVVYFNRSSELNSCLAADYLSENLTI